jgi:hypothetical protein
LRHIDAKPHPVFQMSGNTPVATADKSLRAPSFAPA